MPDLTVCVLCEEPKEDSEFPQQFSGKRNGRQCRRCLNARTRERYAQDADFRELLSVRNRDRYWSKPGVREHRLETNRNLHLMKSHGMTPEDYERFAEAHGRRCAVCDGEQNLHIDHWHGCCDKDRSCSKCRRGLLCVRCNTGLGMFLEDPDLLRKMIAYLDPVAA